MPSTSDARFAALRNQGFTGSTSDMLHAWLKANTGQTGSVSDLWKKLYNLHTTPGAAPDQRRRFFPAIGYDDERSFWLAGGVIAGGVTLVSVALAPDGVTYTLTFSEDITATTPIAGWSVTVDGKTDAADAAVVLGDTLTITQNDVAFTGDDITVSYDASTGDVAGVSGVLADVVDFAVTNNSAQAAPCTFPLNADPATVTGVGFTGPLTLTNADQTVSKTTDLVAGQYAAFNPLTPLDVALGTTTVQLNVEELPVYIGAAGSHALSLSFFDALGGVEYSFSVASASSSANGFELHTSSGYFNTLLAAPPRRLGVTFDADTSLVHFKVDEVIIESVAYTPQALAPIVTVAQNAPDAANVGQNISASFVTNASDITQAVRPSDNPCGNAIPAPIPCVYRFDATEASGDYFENNSTPMVLTNDTLTMSCVLTGTPAHEFEAFPVNLWADRAGDGGLTFTPAGTVIGMQVNFDALPPHPGGGSGFTVAYAVNLACLAKAFDNRVFVTVEATDDGRFYPALRNQAGDYVWEALTWVDNVLALGWYHDPVADKWGIVARTVTGATTTNVDYGYIAALDGYAMRGPMYGFVEVIEGAAAAAVLGATVTVTVDTSPSTWDLLFPADTHGVCAAVFVES